MRKLVHLLLHEERHRIAPQRLRPPTSLRRAEVGPSRLGLRAWLAPAAHRQMRPHRKTCNQSRSEANRLACSSAARISQLVA